MKLTEEQIKEIAELLDCGMTCYVHRSTGAIEYHPDTSDLYFDPEPWQEVLDKINNDRDSYEQFEKMGSNQSFRVRVNFARSLADASFGEALLEGLSKRKPFQQFRNLIDSSDYRQDWFDFKKQAYSDWVKQQI